MVETTLLAAANTYEPKSSKTKNIAELGIVDLTTPITDDEWTDKKTGIKKTQKVITVNGEKYRVPAPVLEQIKELVSMGASLGKSVTKVKIERSGTTQTDTRYKVGAVM